MEILEIKELSLDTIRPNSESMKTDIGGSKVAIIGKPGSGKSVLIRHLLHSKQHLIPAGLVISGSEDTNMFYSKIFPTLFIYNEYRKEIIENVIKRQKLAKQYLPNAWMVLVLDDCMADTSAFNNPLLVGLFKNSRHWNMLTILANQYVFDLKPENRTMLDGVFIFRDPIKENRKKLYNNFASIIPSINIFNQLMDELTNDFTCIYINNQIQSNVWTDCVFWFKAEQTPQFTFGCDDYIHFSEQRYDDSYVL